MKLETPTISITVLDTIYDMAASVRGTGVLTLTGERLDLADVTNSEYETILSNSYRVEDVGSIEVIAMFVILDWYIKGNGQWRWQISGDGGTTWVTITEVTDNQVAFTEYQRGGAGLWLSSIDVGTDKLQVRLQARAVSGTVSTQVVDTGNFVRFLYRKWVLT